MQTDSGRTWYPSSVCSSPWWIQRNSGMFPAWLLLSLVVTSNRSLPLSAFQLSHLYSGGRVAQNSETLS